jgi:hypothetical protein
MNDGGGQKPSPFSILSNIYKFIKTLYLILKYSVPFYLYFYFILKQKNILFGHLKKNNYLVPSYRNDTPLSYLHKA